MRLRDRSVTGSAGPPSEDSRTHATHIDAQAERSLTPELNASTLELLAWLARRPRTYAETMDAWRSSCPELTVWEDALIDGLVRVIHRPGATGQATVALTARGLGGLAER